MPSSAKDRFTVDFEYLFFFVKSNDPQYWTNSKTGRVVTKKPLGTKGTKGVDWDWQKIGNDYSGSNTKIPIEKSEMSASPRARVYRIKKQKKVSLWTGHDYWFEQQFEIYQESSIERMNYPRYSETSKGMSQEYAVVNPDYNKQLGRNKRCVWHIPTQSCSEAHFAVFPEALIETPIKAGCPPGGVVLDPFIGSGTTGVVARKLGRDFIGIELQKEYIPMAHKRIMAVPESLFKETP